MLTEDKRRDYSLIDPYMKQSIGQDITNIDNDETENEIQIHDYAQFDYEKFRDKRQIIPETSAMFTDSLYQNDDVESERVSKMSDEDNKPYVLPLYVITAAFAAMLVVGPLLVCKGPHRGIIQSSIMLSAFCMWILWFTIYFAQMNPLMGPRLDNSTLAWLAYKLGKHIKDKE